MPTGPATGAFINVGRKRPTAGLGTKARDGDGARRVTTGNGHGASRSKQAIEGASPSR